MEKRSFAAWAAEKTLKLINTGCFDSVEKAQKYMNRRSRVEDRAYKLPLRVYRSNAKLTEYQGNQVIRFSPNHESARTVFYLHGGAYVQQISFFHIRYCDILCSKANVNIVIPLYRLAPNHTWKETYDFLFNLYNDEHPSVIMGDSAGGGLAAGFVQYLSETSSALPDKVCLLSPWADASMSADYSDYEKKDPMLGVDGLREMGRTWAGNLDAKDPKISPLYGNFEHFPQTLLFTGTREIFYPDVTAFYKKLIQAGRTAELVVGNGLNHVYPLYPIPEAKAALKSVLDFISDKSKRILPSDSLNSVSFNLKG